MYKMHKKLETERKFIEKLKKKKQYICTNQKDNDASLSLLIYIELMRYFAYQTLAYFFDY